MLCAPTQTDANICTYISDCAETLLGLPREPFKYIQICGHLVRMRVLRCS